MITQIESWPLGDRGRPETKSIVIWPHFHCGISKGWSNPWGLWCSALTCWHVVHRDTYLATALFIPGHLYCRIRSRYIFVLPGCIASFELWNSCKISSLIISGTYSLPPNHRYWSASKVQSGRSSLLISRSRIVLASDPGAVT